MLTCINSAKVHQLEMSISSSYICMLVMVNKVTKYTKMKIKLSMAST